MLERRRLLVRYYCALGAAALLAGTFAIHLWASTRPPSTGTLLVMASARTGDHLRSGAIAVHSGAGWRDVGSGFQGAVAKAPDNTQLSQTAVPIGSYDAIRIGGQVLEAAIAVHADQVEPVLLTVSGGAIVSDGLYAGSEEVGLGLNELSGQLQPMPPFQLLDQAGRPFDGTSVRGRVTVLAAFHTSCQTTCPLYTGLFFQLRKKLPASVQLVEATTDPEQDTVQALATYAGQIGAPWRFVTGSRPQMEAFWQPLGVQLSGDQLHTSTLAVIDAHGYIRSVYRGVPDVGGSLPAPLASSLNAGGRQELSSHGDGWGTSQVLDTLAAVDKVSQQPAAGGAAAPDFTTTDLAGRSIGLARFRGRPLLINFWATWCSVCRQEMPMVQRIAKAHPGLTVLLVDEGDSTDAARRFLAQIGVTLTVASDPDEAIAGRYRVGDLPTSVFVRADGSIASRYPGAMDQRALEQHLAGLGGST